MSNSEFFKINMVISDIEKFNKIKEKEEEIYKKLEGVYCPYLNKKVAFNRKGLEHITMKEWNKSRLVSDQYMRIKLLKFAPIVISKYATLQECEEKRSFER